MANKSPPKFYTIQKISAEDEEKFKNDPRLIPLEDSDGNSLGSALYDMNNDKWAKIAKFVNINYKDNTFGKHQLSGTIKDGKWNEKADPNAIFLMDLRLTGTPEDLRKYAEDNLMEIIDPGLMEDSIANAITRDNFMDRMSEVNAEISAYKAWKAANPKKETIHHTSDQILLIREFIKDSKIVDKAGNERTKATRKAGGGGRAKSLSEKILNLPADKVYDVSTNPRGTAIIYGNTALGGSATSKKVGVRGIALVSNAKGGRKNFKAALTTLSQEDPETYPLAKIDDLMKEFDEAATLATAKKVAASKSVSRSKPVGSKAVGAPRPRPAGRAVARPAVRKSRSRSPPARRVPVPKR